MQIAVCSSGSFVGICRSCLPHSAVSISASLNSMSTLSNYWFERMQQSLQASSCSALGLSMQSRAERCTGNSAYCLKTASPRRHLIVTHQMAAYQLSDLKKLKTGCSGSLSGHFRIHIPAHRMGKILEASSVDIL